MKYRNLLLLSAILSISAIYAAATQTRIWENPTVEINTKSLGGFFQPLIEVTRVELGENETVISFHAGYRSELAFNFSPESYIISQGVKYPVIGSEGIDYTIGIDNIPNSSIDFKLRFPALPKGTNEFDFVNGQGIHIHGITDGSGRRAQVIPSNWRDDKTGDWLIGLFDECVVYDARFWDYAGHKPTQSSKSFEISDGDQTLRITLGKEKNGKRKIKIGDRNFCCSAITGRTLAPYPTEDSRQFRDTRYAVTDSVEFIGWLKDMPISQSKRTNEYNVTVYNYKGFAFDYSCEMDSLGRFSMKFPMENTGEIYGDWGRSSLRNVFEPGQRYFFLQDYKHGQTLFMGPDSRVQNELMIHVPHLHSVIVSNYRGQPFRKYFHDLDSINTVLDFELDSVTTRYPTLSDRFRKTHLVNNRIKTLGRYLSLVTMPDTVIPYLMKKCLPYISPQYPFSREAPEFIKQAIKTLNNANEKAFDFSIYENEIEYTPDEQVVLAKIDSITAVFQPVYEAMADGEEKEAYRIDHLRRNEPLIMELIKIMKGGSRNRVYVPKKFMHNIPLGSEMLDSLGFDPIIKEMWMAYEALEAIELTRSSLSPEIVTYLKENINTPLFLNDIMAENDKYIQIEQRASKRDTDADTSMLKGLTEGEKLLEKILEPHRGKIVLIDFWGTWCGPCRESLLHSAELYERLKDYDMVYIYLANHSDERAWRNTIEEYNVKGDNVFHYNLPSDQQTAIENLLEIREFPSYRLVDKEGKVLDVNADPHMRGGIESLLRNIND